MRIRHLICTDNFAGVERYVATTSAELARRGHHVEIIGGAPQAMRHALGAAPVALIRAGNARAALRPARRRPRPDLVHAHMTAADTVAIANRAVVRAPIVSTLHFAQPRGHSPLTRTLYRVIPRLVTAQIAISRFVADHTGGHPQIIPNGVPAAENAPDLDPPTRRPVVLVAQRFETEKDTATALDAFAASGLADHGWQLHLAGQGSQRDDLETLALTRRIGHATTFLGHVDDLHARMRHAGLFLATATAEAFGLSVVEAMAHGLPVIATDSGAHPETIGSATPETLFPPGDTATAARLLARYAADPDARAELSHRVRARYDAAFTIERHVDALETLYRDLLDGRRPAQSLRGRRRNQP